MSDLDSNWARLSSNETKIWKFLRSVLNTFLLTKTYLTKSHIFLIGANLAQFGTNLTALQLDNRIESGRRSGMSNRASKLGQIVPKWDKSGTF